MTESTITEPNNCPNGENYSPCHCIFDRYNGQYHLFVNNISIEQIQQIFNSAKPTNSGFVYLEILAFIPKDVFIEHQFTTISLIGIDQKYSPIIHPEAFRSCRTVCREFKLKSLDMTKMNFSFLAGFNSLEAFLMLNVVNIHFTAFPILGNLHKLEIQNSSGLNHFRPTSSPLSVFNQHKFFTLKLIDNRLSDKSAERFLKWIAAGPSNETLNESRK